MSDACPISGAPSVPGRWRDNVPGSVAEPGPTCPTVGSAQRPPRRGRPWVALTAGAGLLLLGILLNFPPYMWGAQPNVRISVRNDYPVAVHVYDLEQLGPRRYKGLIEPHRERAFTSGLARGEYYELEFRDSKGRVLQTVSNRFIGHQLDFRWNVRIAPLAPASGQ